jgi:hypothetical protein
MSAEQTQRVRQELEDTLSGVTAELTAIASGSAGVSTEDELKFIRTKLLEMLESLDKGTKVETPGLWHVVIDTWPYGNQLREKIVKAELSYERLKGLSNSSGR